MQGDRDLLRGAVLAYDAPHKHGVTGKGDIPLPVERVATLLAAGAMWLSRGECDRAVCKDCQRAAVEWWNVYIQLTPDQAKGLVSFLTRNNTALPWKPKIMFFLDPLAEWES